MTILGLHHITLGSSDAQRTVDFYGQTLGLRFIKRTVNFDDPGSYHLYFGDEVGSPGTAVTFFEWPGVPKGYPGVGGTHHFALTVKDRDGLLMWKRRLTDLGIGVDGPYNRAAFEAIQFRDPDGVILEIATRGPGFTSTVTESAPAVTQPAGATETWPDPVPDITPEMALRYGMHHITAISSDLSRTAEFYEGLLGLCRVKETTNADDPGAQWYWSATPEGKPGTLISYFQRDARQTRRVKIGTGQTHHFALAVENDEIQLTWREKLVKAGLRVSPVMDRSYFHSIYTNDPDGHIVELATLNPGFPVDEPVSELGGSLKLPPWLEAQRPEIERVLRPLTVPEWKKV